MVEKLKNLAEPDKLVQEKTSESLTRSSRSPLSKQSTSQEAQTVGMMDESMRSEPVKVGSCKALTLKQPAASGDSVLEARKRRFEQLRISDSNSDAIQSSSAVETKLPSKLRRQFSPPRGKESRQSRKDLKAQNEKRVVVTKSKASGNNKAAGKMQRYASDISDLTSANSSVSLEDISEDESSQVRERQSGERCELDFAKQQSGQVKVIDTQFRDYLYSCMVICVFICCSYLGCVECIRCGLFLLMFVVSVKQLNCVWCFCAAFAKLLWPFVSLFYHVVS